MELLSIDNRHMKELTIEEVKQIEYELLCKLDKVCKENDIDYSLTGGTLIGAVRHGGFIPWDDDIDIQMPRKDYMAFLEICEKEDVGFDVISIYSNPKYTELFAKVMARDTLLVEENREKRGYDLGINIDIFPVDGMGHSYKEAKARYRRKAFQRELLVAAKWSKFFRSKSHAWYYEPIRFGMFVLSRCVSGEKMIKQLDKYCMKYDMKEMEYSTIFSGVYRTKEIMESEYYMDYIDCDFEKGKFPILKRYDPYLRKIFGDYTTMPPKDKRVSHHSFRAYKI